MKATRVALFLSALLTLLALAFGASAQPYPNKPVQIIVAVPAGTAGDVTARLIADELGEKLNQRFVVVNKPGANGVIAGDLVTTASHDGYTLFFSASSPLTVTPHLVKDLKWNPLKDLEPIVEVGTTPIVIAVARKSPINSMNDLIAAARKEPSKVTAGMLSLSMSQFAIAMLESGENIRFLSVPYKGATDIASGVLAGDIDVAFVGLGGLAAQLGPGGQLKALGVTTTERMASLPDTPAVGEVVKGYDAGTWFGLFAPKGVDPVAVKTLNAAVNELLKTQRAKSRLETLGTNPTGGTPADLQRRLETDNARFGKLIAQLGIKAQ